MIQSHKINVKKTAHYYTLGTPSTSTKRFWIICHGYGQRANRFLEQFQLLDLEENFILAPEGLHRFYWQGLSGDVAASWMTKADRLDDIADYAQYLSDVYDLYRPKMNEEVEIIFFGFSQGCATLCRWIFNQLPIFNRLVLWGGRIPQDLNYLPHQTYFSDKNIHFAYGDKDQFLTPELLQNQFDFIDAQQLNVGVWKFEGKHETRKKVLLDFYNEVIV